LTKKKKKTYSGRKAITLSNPVN